MRFILIIIFIVALAFLDRMFFKQNHDFNVSFLYSNLEKQAQWEVPETEIDAGVLDQKYYYLAKGNHCFAFVSEDRKYVIKFHRFASHLRRFSWLYPGKRETIKEHNLERLRVNFQSYRDAFCDLKEEAGLLMVHINPSSHLRKSVTLVDSLKSEYRVSLDEVMFVLQRKADPILPALEKMMAESRISEAKQVISSVIQLIASDASKGYVDKDPVLRRNYGLLGTQAIHIDVGDLVKCNFKSHRPAILHSLREQIERNPALLEHYEQEIQRL